MESTEGHVATVHLKGPKSGIEVLFTAFKDDNSVCKKKLYNTFNGSRGSWVKSNKLLQLCNLSQRTFQLKMTSLQKQKKKITRAWGYISSQTNSEENKSASAVMIFLVSQVLAVKHFGCRELTSSFHWFAIFLSSSTESTLIFWATLHRGT